MGEQPNPKPHGIDVIADFAGKLRIAVENDVSAALSERGADMLMERRALGIERYGQPLMSEDGRDTRRDLREELLDASAYAWSLALQTKARGEEQRPLVALAIDLLIRAVQLDDPKEGE